MATSPTTSPATAHAVFAGTFDPVSDGHVCIARQAAARWGAVVMLVANNPAKLPVFSAAERVSLIRAATRGIDGLVVDATSGRVVDFARGVGARVLVRGSRGLSDDAAEADLRGQNITAAPDIETVMLTCPEQLHVSSSALRAAARAGQPFPGGCSPETYAALVAKLRG